MRRMLCAVAVLLSLSARAEELGVREHHRIPLRLRAGEAARVRVDQTKLDVVVGVKQAQRGIAYEVSNPYDNTVPEEVFVVAEHDEEWLLDIRPRGATTKGSYTLAIERHPATADDRRRADTEAAYWHLAELIERRFHEVHRQYEQVLAEAQAIATAYRELGDLRREAETMLHVSEVLHAGGKRDEAGRMKHDALARARESGFAPLVPYALDLVAVTYEKTDPQKSVDLLSEALAGARRLGLKLVVARVLNRFGSINREIDPPLALDYLNQAIAIWTETGDRQRLAYGHHNTAGSYRSLARYGEAVEAVDRALAIFRELGDDFAEAQTLVTRGIFLNFAGRTGEAALAFEEALAFARAHGFLSPTVTSLIAYAHLRAGCEEWLEARRLLDEAEVVAREVGGVEMVADNRAMIDLRTGHADRALPVLQRAVDAAEARWKELRGGSLRSKFFAHERFRYDAVLDALVRLGREDEAFSLAERSRSRALLSLLSEVRTDLWQNVPAELVARAGALERELAQFPPQPDEAARRELTRITTELEQVEGEMRRAQPGYRSLTDATAPTIAHVQSLLDDDTLVLYYHLSFNSDVRRGFLWALTKSDAQLAFVPDTRQLDPMVRVLMQHLGAGSADRNLTRVRTASPRDATFYWRAAAQLSDTILGPVRDRIRAAKRIVVIADGMLQYVPFAALPMPGSARSVPLADTHAVLYLPSASVLELLRTQAASRPPAPKTLALFGDPVFSAQDARARGAAVQVASQSSDRDLMRAVADVGLTRDGAIPRLVYTASEASAIAALVPAPQRRVLTGFDATKRAALEDGLAGYRIVHFATHGIVDDTHPQLSGLLLSRYDRQGRPTDGFLRLNEIFQMRLGAELVVLSGCRTGLGKAVRSEGMVGLARGFLYAGAQKVVVSLWNVDDRATAELMARFYRGMLQDGVAPAEALRRAQASIRREPRWSHPYYWAAFTYTGDWR